MKKEDLIKLGLDDTLAQKVVDASAEELKGFIPKARFDEVNNLKKQLEEDIKTRDTQLETLKKVDAEGLKAEIEKLQNENKTAKEKFEAELKQINISNAVEKALLGAKAKNIKAVKALIDLEKAEIDGESIKGLDEQIKKLQESEDSKFLFDVKAEDKQQLKGFKPAESSEGTGNNLKPTTLADAVKSYFNN